MPPENANIARHLALMAARQPAVAALKVPRGRTRTGDIDYLTLSFSELAAEVASWKADLTTRGVRPADRVLVMVRPGLPLIAAAFALFSLGAVPIVIDPGMGLKSFLACVVRSQPRVLLGIPLARVISRVYRKTFRSVQIRVPASGSATARKSSAGGQSASGQSSADFQSASLATSRLEACATPTGRLEACATPTGRLEVCATRQSDLSAILFTSGSTGAPKGVCYTHGMFDAQVELIRATYDIRPGEIDLPLLPLFALFNPALGMTTVVPEIDPSRPATVDPRKIIQAIRQEGVTSSFGSPTLWRKIAVHCKNHHVELPTLRRVLCAGAPVPPDLWDLMTPVLTQGTLHSPYGATEALPVSSISAPEVHGGTAAATARGAGTCVGHPLAANQVKIIALTDAPLATLADTRELPAGQIGEIIVRGPTVTQTYDGLPEATAAAKIGVGGGGRGIPNDQKPIPNGQKPNPMGQIPNHMGQIPNADCAAAAIKSQIPNAGPDAGGNPSGQIPKASGQIPNSMGQIPIPNGQNPNPNYTGFDATGAGAAAGICDLEFGICAPVAGVLPASSAVADDAGWHRMGDLGYLDAEGRLWFCGRKAERVETVEGPLYTEQIEPLFNAHTKVRRCALIGLGERGRQRVALVVEPDDWAQAETSSKCRPFARELRELAKTHTHTAGIKTFYFLKKLPVDVRHNAKIHRLSLARWALTAKGYESDPKR